jgi:hypothetical protein
MSTITIEREAPQVVPEVTREVTARDILLRAADLLEEFGWCQHISGSKEMGEMCAAGAIREAHAEWDGDFDAGPGKDLWDDIYRALEPQVGAWDLPSWNDAGGRTKKEVTTLLREAALNA